MGDMVRGVDGLQKGFRHVRGEVGTFYQGDAFAPVGVDNGAQAVGDMVKSFLPTGGSPFARTSLAVTDQRRLQALLVIQQGHSGSASGA